MCHPRILQQVSLLSLCCLLLLLLLCMQQPVPSSQLCLRCGSHGTTAAVLQGIPFVTAKNGASARVRFCACVPSCNTIRTIPTRSCSDLQKQPRSAHTHTGGTPAVFRFPAPTCDTPGTPSQIMYRRATLYKEIIVIVTHKAVRQLTLTATVDVKLLFTMAKLFFYLFTRIFGLYKHYASQTCQNSSKPRATTHLLLCTAEK